MSQEGVANRFDGFEFTIPSGSTIEDGLLAVFERYDFQMGDKKPFRDIVEMLAMDIPEIARTVELERHPIIGARKLVHAKAVRQYQRQLNDNEIWYFKEAVRNHDRELSADFTSLESWVKTSDAHDLQTSLENSTGTIDVWGVLSHPMLETSVIITSKRSGGIFDRKKEVEGLYLYDRETEHSVGFGVEAVETMRVPYPFDSAGKTRIHANRCALDCYLPGIDGGDIPNVGMLRISIPTENRCVSIPLGAANTALPRTRITDS